MSSQEQGSDIEKVIQEARDKSFQAFCILNHWRLQRKVAAHEIERYKKAKEAYDSAHEEFLAALRRAKR